MSGLSFYRTGPRRLLELADGASAGVGHLLSCLLTQCVVAPDKKTFHGLQQDRAVNLICVLVDLRKAQFGKKNRLILG